MENILLPHKVGLIVATLGHAKREQIAVLAAELVRNGPLTVLDGGNCFPFYRFARLLKAHTNKNGLAAGRLYIQRAFTCYQMLTLLESAPALPQPFLVLEMLGTFYDEQVPEWEVSRLLGACLGQVKRLCLHAPVMLLLSRPLLSGRGAHLLERVCRQADQTFGLAEPAPELIQPTLF